MTTMKKRSHSNDQAKLKILCDDLCDDIENLLSSLDLDYKNNSKMVSMKCPIHGGDNEGAVNLYVQGDSYRGNWKCRTHGCEKIFKGSILGFIRGVLSHTKYRWSKEGDKTCSFDEAVSYATAFLNKDLSDIKISKSLRNKQSFTNAIKYVGNNNDNSTSVMPSSVTRSMVRRSLSIPATYYLNRGYGADVLDKYDIGLCTNPNKEMYNRVVAPIYDNNHEFLIGCTGRSIFEKCHVCGSYHDQSRNCPDIDKRWLFSKWKHSANFKSQNTLYNYWYAKEWIQKLGYVIIVESPGNVWKLEEHNIHNSVAIFGSSISDRQKVILDSSGAMTIIVLTDNDDAGKQAAKQIQDKCSKTYRVFIPTISQSDVAEMTAEQIKLEIIDYIESKI